MIQMMLGFRSLGSQAFNVLSLSEPVPVSKAKAHGAGSVGLEKRIRGGFYFSFSAFRNACTLSVFSQVKLRPLRPKCPSWAVSR